MGATNQTNRIMRKLYIDGNELKNYEVLSGKLCYEDIFDDVYGAEDWVEDALDAVGFIDGTPVKATVLPNVIAFHPFPEDDRLERMRTLFLSAKSILRSIEFCVARVMREEEEPSCLAILTDTDEAQYFEDECGIVVCVCINYNENEVNVFFYTK